MQISKPNGYTSTLMTLALPTIFENIMVTLVSYVDTAMVGSLGPAATSAVAINSSPTWLFNAAVMAISVGSTVLVAQRMGAHDAQGAGSVGRQSFVLGMLTGFFLMLLGLAISPFLPLWMGAQPEVAPLASEYFAVVSLGFFAQFTGLILAGVLRGAGDMRTPMTSTIAANLVNVCGNYLLIFESHTAHIFGLSFPVWGAGLGVVGAAISTAFSITLSGVLLLIAMMRRSDALRFTRRLSFKLRKADVEAILRIGIPAAMERCAISLGQVLYLRMVAGLGTVQLAAHHLAITAESLCYNPSYGFAAAATTLVGQSLGAQEHASAKRYAWLSVLYGFVVMMATSVALFLFAQPILRIFSSDAQVIAYGAQALRIVAFAEPFFSLAIVASGALRGAGDTKVPLYIALLCMLAVRLSTCYLFVYVLNMGLAGAWLAMCCDLTLRGLLTAGRLMHVKWRDLRILHL